MNFNGLALVNVSIHHAAGRKPQECWLRRHNDLACIEGVNAETFGEVAVALSG